MSIRILITGGTFDKDYDEITGRLYFNDTHMNEILELGRSKLDVKIKKLMLLLILALQNLQKQTLYFQ